MVNYSQKTQDLIDRMCRNVERNDFELNRSLAEELILKTYDLFNLSRPKKIIWCKDLQDKQYQKSAQSAQSARSASSARLALSASSALDYDFDWYIYCFEYKENPKNLPNENDNLYLKYSELLMQAKEAGLGYRIEWEDTLYLVPTPLVKINSLNQFHSTNSPAIKWKGGQEIFYLNGVMFNEKLFKEVTSGKMPFEKILAIPDVDQRTQAMRFGDVEQFIKFTNGKLLDTYKKHTLDGVEINYSLYEIPKGDIFTQNAFYCIYDCPSTGKKYMQGVAPAKTVAEAMAWKISDELNVVTPEDWKLSIPLVHES